MGVSNVNNLDKTGLVKLALAQKQGKLTAAAKPTYLTANGSIFNAPGVKNSQSTNETSDLNKLNTLKSLNDLNKSNSTSSASKSSSANSKSGLEDMKNIDNAADGKAAASEVSAQKDNVSDLTKQTENNTKEMEKTDSDATRLNKTMKKDTKTFEKQMKKNEQELQKNQQEIAKETKTLNTTQSEVDSIQAEIEALTAGDNTGVGKTSAFSLSIGNAVNEAEPGQMTEHSGLEKVQLLQEQLGAKIELMSGSQQKIYTLQKSSTKTIKTMNKLATKQVSVNKTNQENIEANQTKAQKVIETAGKIEQVASLVTTAGTTLNYAGKGLVALGSAMSSNPFTAAVGAALITTGKVMSQVGTVTEMVGQYGQAAAGLTKTVAYAADGNLAGALTSAGSAIMAGVSAGKSTTNLSKNLDAINKQAEAATQKLAADRLSKEAIAQKTQNMTSEQATEALGNQTKKEARKAMSADLQQQMANGQIQGNSAKELIANANSSNATSDALNRTINKTNQAATNAVKKAAQSTNFFDKIQKYGNTLLSAGSMLAQTQQNQGTPQTTTTSTKPKVSKFNAAKANSVIDWTNQRRAAGARYAYGA